MKFQITIPTPCHEDWNKMTSTQKGKFCKSCSKEVIDFTELSHREISKTVLHSNNICGRFKSNQLNKEVEVLETNAFSKIAATIALITSITVTQPILSQENKDKIEKVNQLKENRYFSKDSVASVIVIKGKLKYEKEMLPGVSIPLKGTKISTKTDFDGVFSIKIPNKRGSSTILVFSYIGFITQEINILKIKKPLIVEMKEDTQALGEIVVVGGMIAVEKKPNLFQKIGDLFRKKENKKY